MSNYNDWSRDKRDECSRNMLIWRQHSGF